MGPALLWINCAAFLGFGLGFALAPTQLADLILGVAPTAPSALIDMRATYGGITIGTALFFGLCAARPNWQHPGLVASALMMGGLATARVLGIVVDGEPNGFMLGFLALEVLAAVLSLAALRQSERSLVTSVSR